MTDLIEGKFYYTDRGIEKCHYCKVNGVIELVTPKGKVLAPVPSYEELKKIKSECKSLSYGLDVAVKRNRYLLRLLKECKDRFVAVTTNIPINLEDCDLINRVHQEVYDLETEL